MAKITQDNYNTIVKILQNGAPALANELIASINDLLSENEYLNRQIRANAEQNNAVENKAEEE